MITARIDPEPKPQIKTFKSKVMQKVRDLYEKTQKSINLFDFIDE